MRHRHFLLLPFLLFCIVLLSCRNKDGNTNPINFGNERFDSTALHIAVVPNADCLPIYYAKQAGLFDSVGVKVQLISFSSQFDCDVMLKGKYADGGWADIVALKKEGKFEKEMKVMWYGRDKWSLLTCGKLRISNISSLKGKTVAFPRISSESQWFETLLNQKKVKQSDIYCPQIKNLKLRTQMLTNNQVDATILCWPYTSLALSQGNRLLVSQNEPTNNVAFVLKQSILQSKVQLHQWRLFEQARHMALDSIVKYKNKAFSKILQTEYRFPKEVSDTITYDIP